jgi:uncharacterized protein (TIGR00304 family)
MADIVLLGVAVVFVGLVLIMASALRGTGRTEMKGGGVLLIGPIPIVWGSDAKWASLAIVLAIVLVLLSLAANIL